MKFRPNPRQVGFTLIELMIVVVIIGIISAIAVPAYNNYVMRGRMQAAQAALKAQSVRMAQFAQDHETFVGSCASLEAPVDYTLSCSNLTTTGWTVTATANAGTAEVGSVFVLNSDGTMATTGAPSGWTTSTSCWTTDKSGTCAIQ